MYLPLNPVSPEILAMFALAGNLVGLIFSMSVTWAT